MSDVGFVVSIFAGSVLWLSHVWWLGLCFFFGLLRCRLYWASSCAFFDMEVWLLDVIFSMSNRSFRHFGLLGLKLGISGFCVGCWAWDAEFLFLCEI